LGQFIFFGLLMTVVNHEFDACVPKDGLHKVEGKATESVPVGNHNFLDHSLVAFVQYLLQPSTLEVNSAGNVRDDLVFRIRFLEESDLSFKVCSLLVAGYPGIDVSLTLLCSSGLESKVLCDGVDIIEPVATLSDKTLDVSLLGPFP